MSLTASVFFNTDRTYVTVVEPTPKGLALEYLNSTESRIDLENPESTESLNGAKELEAILTKFVGKIDRLTVTLPSDSVLVTQFPTTMEIDPSELRRLVDFEIRQNYPQFNFKDFTVSVTPLSVKPDGKRLALGVIIHNSIFKAASEFVKPLGQLIDFVEISQMNANSAFMYNYPEEAKKNTALVCIQNSFIDVSICKAGEPAYYNLLSFSDPMQVGELLENEFTKITEEIVPTIDGAFFFGAGLSKDIMMTCWETAMLMGFEAKRLNPFRMVTTKLDARDREYCSRVFQCYPPCIGGSAPAYHKRFKLY